MRLHLWQVQFLVLALIWGSGFAFIKGALTGFSAIEITAIRVTLGALLLLAVCRMTGRRLPRGLGVWTHLAVAGSLFMVAPFTLIAWGEQQLPSYVAGIWNATTPLWATVFVLWMISDEQLTPRKVLGLATGFAGTLVILGPWRGIPLDATLSHLAFAGAALCYGLSFPYAKRFLLSRGESSIAISACQMVMAAAIAGAVALGSESPPGTPGWDAVASVAFLGLFGTGTAYILNYNIVNDQGASIASTIAYAIPVVATVIGVLFLGEVLTLTSLAGAVLVLVGITLVQSRSHRTHP